MAEKTLKTRIQLKNETAENWGKATNFTPKQGEMIVYNYDIPRLKIGDGNTNVNSLSFLDENFVFKTTTINSKPLSGNITLTKTDLGLGNVGNFKAVSTIANQGLTSSEKNAARANIGAGTSSFSGDYDDLTNKPTIPNYSVATSTSNGLMSSSDKNKLDGIAAGANKYTHPTYTAKSSGLYKVTIDATGHVSATTAVTKSDITALGIPSSDTTYTVMTGATSSSAGTSGLVPAPASGKNTSFLRGDGTWAIPATSTYSQATSTTLGLVKIGYIENEKNYPVELSNGQMFVNVPWHDTTYTLSSFGITATANELNYCDGVTSNIQTQLDSKAPFSHTHTGYAKSTHTHIGSQIIGLSASRALVSNSSGQVAVAAVTATELGYLDGVTSNILIDKNKCFLTA